MRAHPRDGITVDLSISLLLRSHRGLIALAVADRFGDSSGRPSPVNKFLADSSVYFSRSQGSGVFGLLIPPLAGLRAGVFRRQKTIGPQLFPQRPVATDCHNGRLPLITIPPGGGRVKTHPKHSTKLWIIKAYDFCHPACPGFFASQAGQAYNHSSPHATTRQVKEVQPCARPADVHHARSAAETSRTASVPGAKNPPKNAPARK